VKVDFRGEIFKFLEITVEEHYFYLLCSDVEYSKYRA
jgi:hypothetical protein